MAATDLLSSETQLLVYIVGKQITGAIFVRSCNEPVLILAS